MKLFRFALTAAALCAVAAACNATRLTAPDGTRGVPPRADATPDSVSLAPDGQTMGSGG